MVYVPPGVFEMGAAAPEPSRPPHPVEITRGFFIDALEVTAAEYDACVRAKVCSPSGVHGPRVKPDEVPRFSDYCNGQKPGRELHPINCVDNAQAAEYCHSREKRLPTEAEWEYAARGTDGRAYPWGSDLPNMCDVAVVAGLCSEKGTRPVGTRSAGSASAFGALDMAGNVWEWVADTWDARAYATAPARDPFVAGASALGVLRGGSWDFVRDDAASTFRLRFDRRTGHVSSGVRCARSVE
jgi:formylglycine-generating enzyme required for sulfatase activity